MGSKAENNIVFHLVGFPNDHAVGKRLKVHHTLGDGDFNGFKVLSEAATCVSATIRPDNAVSEMNSI